MARFTHITARCMAACLTAIAASAACAQGPALDVGGAIDESALGKKEYSPYLNDNYPQRVFWGDTHVHTAFSTDAGMPTASPGARKSCLRPAYARACSDRSTSWWWPITPRISGWRP